MYLLEHTYFMNSKSDALPQLQTAFLAQLPALWPLLKGSLALVKKPCIRQNCPACACGDKHPAWIFSFTQGKRRRCMYVPKDLVPLLRQGLQNGRRLEALLLALGPDLLRAHRQQRQKSACACPHSNTVRTACTSGGRLTASRKR